MEKLFDKSEVTFAIVLIVVYVVGSILLKKVSSMIGIEFLSEAVFEFVMIVIDLVIILAYLAYVWKFTPKKNAFK